MINVYQLKFREFVIRLSEIGSNQVIILIRWDLNDE